LLFFRSRRANLPHDSSKIKKFLLIGNFLYPERDGGEAHFKPYAVIVLHIVIINIFRCT
jgi:hypothetical protein